MIVATTLVALIVAGCTVDRPSAPVRPTPTVTAAPPPTILPVGCSGAGAEAVLRALFSDLTAGRSTPVANYFVAPIDFVRWWDPTVRSGQIITFEPGPGSSTETLDALQAHLDALRQHGARGTITGFAAHGYDSSSPREVGGGFTFELHARGNGQTAMADGGGKGTIDCTTGKLKTVVIDTW
jgi:hypothetical protein